MGNKLPLTYLHAPALRVGQRYLVCVLTTNRGRKFPQSTSNLGRQTLLFGEGSPFLGQDGDTVTMIKQSPCCHQAGSTGLSSVHCFTSADDRSLGGDFEVYNMALRNSGHLAGKEVLTHHLQ